jgi:HEAT repeat protein
MIKYIQNLLFKLSTVIFTTAILLFGCYDSDEFPDFPDEFDKKTANFEKIAPILAALPTANETIAVSQATSPDKRIRRAAALRLLTLGSGSEKTVSALTRLAQSDEVPRVRSAAVRALGAVSENAGGVSTVVRAICDPDPNVRLYALKSLLHLDARANNAILEFLANSDESAMPCPTESNPGHTLQEELIHQLDEQGAKFLSLFVDGLSHPRTEVVLQSLKQLRKLGRSAAPAIPALIALMDSPNDNIRFECIQTFTTVGDQHPLIMPTLFNVINDPGTSTGLRNAAKNAVKRIQTQHISTSKQPANGRRPRRPPR